MDHGLNSSHTHGCTLQCTRTRCNAPARIWPLQSSAIAASYASLGTRRPHTSLRPRPKAWGTSRWNSGAGRLPIDPGNRKFTPAFRPMGCGARCCPRNPHGRPAFMRSRAIRKCSCCACHSHLYTSLAALPCSTTAAVHPGHVFRYIYTCLLYTSPSPRD